MSVAGGPFTKRGSYLEHPLIRGSSVEWRDYQVELARSALNTNALVALPTGLGKTIVAALIVAERLKEDPGASVMILAPTKPLCQQHHELMIRVLKLDESSVGLWTGELPPTAREGSIPKLLIATPQLILNELTEGKIRLDKTSTIVLDEAHRAVGNYAYVPIVRIYFSQRKGAHVVGFTASPGDPKG